MADSSPDFEAVYQTHAARVLNVVTRVVGCDDAPDAAQLAWLRISRGLASFRGDAKLSTWVHSIARNAAVDHLRRNAKHAATVPLHLAAALPCPEPGPFQRLVSREGYDRLDQALRTLPPQQQAFLLVWLEGMSPEDAAIAFNVPLGTAKSRTARARQALLVAYNRKFHAKTTVN